MPESIRNAIVIAFVAVLVAMMGVGLLLLRARPTVPAASAARGLPLLVTDRNGGIYDLDVKIQQMERRLAESQVVSQRLMQEVATANEERDRLALRLTGLEKEVRKLRVRVQVAEQRPAPRPAPAPAITPPAPAPTSTAPATTSTPGATLPPPP